MINHCFKKSRIPVRLIQFQCKVNLFILKFKNNDYTLYLILSKQYIKTLTCKLTYKLKFLYTVYSELNKVYSYYF